MWWFHNLTVTRMLVINMNSYICLWKVGYYVLEHMHWSHMKREVLPDYIFPCWGASMLIYTVFGLICLPICSGSVNTDSSCQAFSTFISFLCFLFIHLFCFSHILVFWEIHRMCFAYIHPSHNSSQIYLPSYPPNFVFYVLLLAHQLQIVMSPDSWICGLPCDHCWPTRCDTL